MRWKYKTNLVWLMFAFVVTKRCYFWDFQNSINLAHRSEIFISFGNPILRLHLWTFLKSKAFIDTIDIDFRLQPFDASDSNNCDVVRSRRNRGSSRFNRRSWSRSRRFGQNVINEFSNEKPKLILNLHFLS
jgi:hypothetical protein